MEMVFLLIMGFIFYDRNIQKWIKKVKKVNARFPNESEYTIIPLNIKEFNKQSEFQDEVFGEYKGIHIFVKKSDIYG